MFFVIVYMFILPSHFTPAFLTRKSAALLENDELQRLLDLLEENVSPPIDDAHRMINFDDYLKVT